MPSKPSRSSASVARDPVRVEHEAVAPAQRVDQQRDAPVGADGGRAVADQRELGGGHGLACVAACADHVQRSSVGVRSALLMDPRFLRTFVTVVRLGSFSAAARELGYTQSAVSQHIAVLEADVGAVLLERRPVAPTEAGARLLEHAEPILLRLDAARADVARVAAGPPQRLRIGATPLAAALRRRAGRARAGRDRARGRARRDRPRGRDRRARRGLRRRRRRAGRSAAAAGDRRARGVVHRGAAGRRRAARSPARAAAIQPRRIGRRALDRRARASVPRLPSSPRSPAPTGSARRSPTRDATSRGLLALVAAGHGLALLPERALDGVAALPVSGPALVHRTEWLDARDNPTSNRGARPIELGPLARASLPSWPPSPNPPSALPSGASPLGR